MKIRATYGYGWSLEINRNGVWLILNGRVFSFFKGTITRRWHFRVWDNAWRIAGRRIPEDMK